MTSDSWAVRPLDEEDVPDLFRLDNAAFHIDPPADFLDDVVRPTVEIGRLTGVREPEANGSLVGSAAILTKRMTFPGARAQPVAAVTYVAVRAGWRRRGILSALMRDQLHRLHRRADEAVAVLTASEGVIYVLEADDIIPACWRLHPPLVQVLPVMFWSWHNTHRHPQASATGALDWQLRMLPTFQARLARMVGDNAARCRHGEHEIGDELLSADAAEDLLETCRSYRPDGLDLERVRSKWFGTR